MPPYQNPPEFPAPAPPQPEHDPYEFFMEAQKAHKKPAFSGGNGGLGLGAKIAFGVVALCFLIASISILFKVVFSKPDVTAPLVTIATSQREIIRVSQNAQETLDSVPLQNFAVTAEVGLTSDQKELIKLIGKLGKKVDGTTLHSTRKSSTDKALAASLTTNSYDTTFTSIMQTYLNTYLERLEAQSSAAQSRTEKAMMEKQAAEARLLIQLLDAPVVE